MPNQKFGIAWPMVAPKVASRSIQDRGRILLGETADSYELALVVVEAYLPEGQLLAGHGDLLRARAGLEQVELRPQAVELRLGRRKLRAVLAVVEGRDQRAHLHRVALADLYG